MRESVMNGVEHTMTQLVVPRVSPRLISLSFIPVAARSRMKFYVRYSDERVPFCKARRKNLFLGNSIVLYCRYTRESSESCPHDYFYSETRLLCIFCRESGCIPFFTYPGPPFQWQNIETLLNFVSKVIEIVLGTSLLINGLPFSNLRISCRIRFITGFVYKKNIRIQNRCGCILKRTSDPSFDVACHFDEVSVLANKTKKS
jgi:hypothetical protein